MTRSKAFLRLGKTAEVASNELSSGSIVVCRYQVPMSRLKFVPAVVVLFLCPLFGQHNALLRSHGVVKVNGVPATSSTVVMEGDRIDTGKNSSASLLLPGRMISAES